MCKLQGFKTLLNVIGVISEDSTVNHYLLPFSCKIDWVMDA